MHCPLFTPATIAAVTRRREATAASAGMVDALKHNNKLQTVRRRQHRPMPSEHAQSTVDASKPPPPQVPTGTWRINARRPFIGSRCSDSKWALDALELFILFLGRLQTRPVSYGYHGLVLLQTRRACIQYAARGTGCYCCCRSVLVRLASKAHTANLCADMTHVIVKLDRRELSAFHRCSVHWLHCDSVTMMRLSRFPLIHPSDLKLPLAPCAPCCRRLHPSIIH